jgi:hypothetical protein
MCVSKLPLAVCVFSSLLVSGALADADDGWVNVRDHGAVCNGTHDDTQAFQKAVAEIKPGGTLRIPVGKCNLRDTIVIDKPMMLAGAGLGSQIYGRTAKSLFQLAGVNGAVVRDLYLGSSSNALGVALLQFVNSHHNRVENVTMLGGYYGVHLFGSLLNTFIDLRTGINFNAGNSAFFAQAPTNYTWVYAERDHSKKISSNANTFITLALEGGTNGLNINDFPDPSCPGCARNGEGSLNIVGGAIEGVSGVGLTIDSTFLPVSVSGVHLEANGTDILINQAANVRMSSILSSGGPGGSGPNGIRVQGAFTRNIQFSDSIIQQMLVDTSVKRFQLQNITTDLQCTHTGGISPPAPWDASVIYTNVGLNCT